MPASNARRRPWKSWKPSSGSTCSVAIASGSSSATASMSMPPLVDSITSGAFALRSKTIRSEVLEAEQRVDVQRRDRVGVLLGDGLDVHAALGRQHHERRLRAAVEDD